MKIFKTYSMYWGILIVVLLSLWSVKPLFIPGFFPTHDDTQVTRIFEMYKALKDGMFPVRWVNDLGYGYGYPIFNFYAPLAYYIGAFFMTFGMNALLATKFTFGVGIILSGVTMYILGRSFWGEEGGIISGLFYQYALYHAVDIYVRGDLSEIWAYAFIPLAFYGLYKVYLQTIRKESSWFGICIAACGLTGVFLSHNLSAVIVMFFIIPFSIMLILFSKVRITTTIFISLSFLFALLLSSFYILPVPFEMKFTNVLSQIGGTADYHNHFVCPSQFWYSPWGYGGSVPGCIDGLSFMLGKISLGFSLLGLLCSSIFWRKKRQRGLLLLGAGIGWILSLFLTTAYSQFIWQFMPVLSYLQYPWRFLIMTSFFTAILSGGVFYTLNYVIKKQRVTYLIYIFVIFFIIIFQGKYFVQQSIKNTRLYDYTNINIIRWNISKISDEYMPKNFRIPKFKSLVIPYPFLVFPPAGLLLSEKDSTIEKQARIKSFENAYLVLGLAYFPAWHYYIDGKLTPISNHSGQVLIFLPKGTHMLTVKYQQTIVEMLGNALSVTGLLGLVLGIMLIRDKKRLHEKENS